MSGNCDKSKNIENKVETTKVIILNDLKRKQSNEMYTIKQNANIFKEKENSLIKKENKNRNCNIRYVENNFETNKNTGGQNLQNDANLNNETKNNFLLNSTPRKTSKQLLKPYQYPLPFKKLRSLYKALHTVQTFNNLRQLKTIFVEVQPSLEKIIRSSVTVVDLERINYYVKIKIKRIKHYYKNVLVDTFSLEIENDDIDKKINEWLQDVCKDDLDWRSIKRREFVLPRKILDQDNINLINSINVEKNDINSNDEHKIKLKKKIINCEDMQLNCNKFNEREIELTKIDCLETSTTRQKIKSKVSITNFENTIDEECLPQFRSTSERMSFYKQKGKARASDILARIKQKEKLRKEEFIRLEKQNNKIEQLKVKIDNVFLCEQSNCVKVDIFVKLMGLKGVEELQEVCEKDSKYFLKKMVGLWYLCKK